jgi:hypothetical protein
MLITPSRRQVRRYIHPADGIVLRPNGLKADEALLTSEDKPAARPPAGQVLSGSSVMAGIGRGRMAAVGGR